MRRYIKEFIMRFSGIIAILFALLVCAMIGSCKTKYIPIESMRTEYVTVHDSVISIDTIRETSSVIIRQLDSLSASAYNIPFCPESPGFLVDRSLFQQKISLQKEKSDSIRTVTQFKEVPVYIEKELTKKQKFMIGCFWYNIGVIIILLICIIKYNK